MILLFLTSRKTYMNYISSKFVFPILSKWRLVSRILACRDTKQVSPGSACSAWPWAQCLAHSRSRCAFAVRWTSVQASGYEFRSKCWSVTSGLNLWCNGRGRRWAVGSAVLGILGCSGLCVSPLSSTSSPLQSFLLFSWPTSCPGFLAHRAPGPILSAPSHPC